MTLDLDTRIGYLGFTLLVAFIVYQPVSEAASEFRSGRALIWETHEVELGSVAIGSENHYIYKDSEPLLFYWTVVTRTIVGSLFSALFLLLWVAITVGASHRMVTRRKDARVK